MWGAFHASPGSTPTTGRFVVRPQSRHAAFTARCRVFHRNPIRVDSVGTARQHRSMAESTRRVAPHTPDWQVIGVLADGDGLPEFSYTVGLHERGLPELFFWDSPSGGDDPGDDWFLRHLERGHLLNRWAGELIEGRLH